MKRLSPGTEFAVGFGLRLAHELQIPEPQVLAITQYVADMFIAYPREMRQAWKAAQADGIPATNPATIRELGELLKQAVQP